MLNVHMEHAAILSLVRLFRLEQLVETQQGSAIWLINVLVTREIVLTSPSQISIHVIIIKIRATKENVLEHKMSNVNTYGATMQSGIKTHVFPQHRLQIQMNLQIAASQWMDLILHARQVIFLVEEFIVMATIYQLFLSSVQVEESQYTRMDKKLAKL